MQFVYWQWWPDFGANQLTKHFDTIVMIAHPVWHIRDDSCCDSFSVYRQMDEASCWKMELLGWASVCALPSIASGAYVICLWYYSGMCLMACLNDAHQLHLVAKNALGKMALIKIHTCVNRRRCSCDHNSTWRLLKILELSSTYSVHIVAVSWMKLLLA